MKPQPLLTPKIRFPCVYWHAHFISNVLQFFILQEGCTSVVLSEQKILNDLQISFGTEVVNRTFLDTFWHTEV